MEIINESETPDFFEDVAQIIEKARKFVGRTADLTMCMTNFEVGRIIVEEEQEGVARAKYGKRLLAELSKFLNDRLGKGYSESTLRNARKFYLVYSPSIQQALLTELSKSQTATGLFDNLQKQQSMLTEFQKKQMMADFLKNPQKSQAMLAEFNPFKLSWSHYLILMRIKNDQERLFYEIEAVKQQWGYRRLQREYGSSLYERLALSRDKDAVMKLSRVGQIIEQPQDMLKNPLVLEFLGMEEKAEYSETYLEQALIDNLQKFLLELGKGFLFEARQKRFTFDEDHFTVDLVFYNRLLQCYVLIDLKTEKLKHQDLGQMQMYVNYFDRFVKTDKETPTVGILLCKEKNDSVVQLTLPAGSNIYASEYSLYLPDKALLQRKLAQWAEEFEERMEEKHK